MAEFSGSDRRIYANAFGAFASSSVFGLELLDLFGRSGGFFPENFDDFNFARRPRTSRNAHPFDAIAKFEVKFEFFLVSSFKLFHEMLTSFMQLPNLRKKFCLVSSFFSVSRNSHAFAKFEVKFEFSLVSSFKLFREILMPFLFNI